MQSPGDINFQSEHNRLALKSRNFFKIGVTNLWNSLPGYVVESPSVNFLRTGWISTVDRKVLCSVLIMTFWASTLCHS